MTDKFKVGDRVRWNSHGGEAKGKIVKRITSPMQIKGHHVAATPDNPEYIVKTTEGKRAAHKPTALRKE